jgi:hypothetical protein
LSNRNSASLLDDDAARASTKVSGILRTAQQYNQANVGVYAEVVAARTARRGDSVTLA